MKYVVVAIGKALIFVIYGICKLFPAKEGKVVFLSRQASQQSIDFKLLEDALRERSGGKVQVVGIYNRIGPGLASKMSFVKDTIRSFYHLSTGRVAVLDAYWPAVSLAKPKKTMTVIQMWHSLGKVKKSGLAALDMPGGQNGEWAKLMNMHGNYDYVVAGAPFWNQFYCESFPITEDQILNFGLPKLDMLSTPHPELAQRIKSAYPELAQGKVVLYVPTFRRHSGAESTGFLEKLVQRGFQVVIKPHPNQPIEVSGVLTCPEFSSLDMLSVADFAITDYSAIALEAAAVGVRTVYYLFDYDDYRENNGLNIDIPEQMPGCVFFTEDELVKGMERFAAGEYPDEVFESYRNRILIPERGHSAADLADFIIGKAFSGTIESSENQEKEE